MTFPATFSEVAFPQGRSYTDSATARTRTRAFVGPSASIETDVPAYGAAHPDDANLQVSNREFAQYPASSQTTSLAIITYSLPALKGVDEEYDMSAVQVQAYFDKDGNEIPNGAVIYEPGLIYSKNVLTTPLTPVTTIGPLIGKTNSVVIFGGAKNTWLYRGCRSREVVGQATPFYLLTHTFQYDPNGWVVYRENLETGALVGYRVYDEADFSALPGIP
ncbi:MAG TPA: hypothetical protein VM238_16440 [Phycisphaerae bacterium]|nr:hypothetical protein [Phycisphaerae bacterium]